MIVTLLIAFIMLAVLGIGFVCLIITLFSLRNVSWQVAVFRISVCVVPMLLVLAAYMKIMGPVDYTSPAELAAVYEKEFRVAPSPDVTELKARVASVGDWYGVWISFHASSDTIDSLLNRFSPSISFNFEQAGHGGSVPEWWTPEADGVEVYYMAENWNPEYFRSTAYIGVNNAKKLVYFHHSSRP